jgi:coenzyme F420-reducing hydrogenase gamma subunit
VTLTLARSLIALVALSACSAQAMSFNPHLLPIVEFLQDAGENPDLLTAKILVDRAIDPTIDEQVVHGAMRQPLQAALSKIKQPIPSSTLLRNPTPRNIL